MRRRNTRVVITARNVCGPEFLNVRTAIPGANGVIWWRLCIWPAAALSTIPDANGVIGTGVKGFSTVLVRGRVRRPYTVFSGFPGCGGDIRNLRAQS